MNKIFVTGGAGYVGAVMVPHLLEQGYVVTVLDLMIYGEHVLPKHNNLNTVKGDIRDQDLLKKLIRYGQQHHRHFQQVDNVLHYLLQMVLVIGFIELGLMQKTD